jgi:2'-5' RNA ligase
LGYPPEKREFSPHLTIGRVTRNANPKEIRAISEALRKCKLGFLGAARIHVVHLYRSDLRPTGAVYTKMFTAELGADGQER